MGKNKEWKYIKSIKIARKHASFLDLYLTLEIWDIFNSILIWECIYHISGENNLNLKKIIMNNVPIDSKPGDHFAQTTFTVM